MTNEQILQVIAGIERALMKCEHYASFSNRIRPHLGAELTDYSIALYPHEQHGPRIRIWDKRFDDGVSIYWSEFNDQQERQNWVIGLRRALKLLDPTAEMERSAQERDLLPMLGKLNAEALDVLKRSREKAQGAIEALAEPPSCVEERKGSFIWTNASLGLKKQFPLLFEGDIDLHKALR
jgi:hypothetical protein